MKKFLYSLLVICLLLACAFMGYKLYYPNPIVVHAHNFDEKMTYSVIGSKAYVNRKCECGSIQHTELTNYIIARPTTAQDILNGDINGKTIVFADGDYGNLEINVTRDTLSAINEYLPEDKNIKGELIDLELIDELSEVGAYHYTRNLENVTFAGTPNANFNGLFNIHSKVYCFYNWMSDKAIGVENSTSLKVDPIRDIGLKDINNNGLIDENDIGYIQHINVINVSFENMNFEGKNGRMLFAYEVDADVSNIDFINCTFETDEIFYQKDSTIGFGAIHIEVRLGSIAGIEIEDIIIENCEFNGHYQAINIRRVNNVKILNNTIKNTEHNAINLQGFGTKGDILIKGNIIENTQDRAIRFANLENAQVVVENNTFVNCTDDAGELIKTQTQNVDSTIEMLNNTYNSKAIENKVYDGNQIIVVMGE